jgi:uncharacterized membrane protein
VQAVENAANHGMLTLIQHAANKLQLYQHQQTAQIPPLAWRDEASISKI